MKQIPGTKIVLGQRVKDKVSGLVGVAMSQTLYLNGCVRVGVQPPMDKDGKVPEPHFFDEVQLELLEEPAVVADAGEDRGTGGPADHTPRREAAPR